MHRFIHLTVWLACGVMMLPAAAQNNAPSPAAAVPQNVTIKFTNNTGGAFTDDNVFVFFSGPVTGTINTASKPAISTQKTYTLKDLARGVTVTSLSGRIYVSQGADFQADANGNYTPNFLFAGTDPTKSSISIPWGFVEITYQTGIVSVINLSNVDFYGFPISITSTDPNGSSTTLDYQVTGSRLESDLVGLVTATTSDKTIRNNTYRSDSNGNFLRIVSPVHMPDAYPDLQPYLSTVHKAHTDQVFATLEGQYSRFGGANDPSCGANNNMACNAITTTNPYSGSGSPTDSQHACRYQTQTYQYTARFKSATDMSDNTIVLEGGGACIGSSGYTIEIDASQLPGGIYSGVPAFTVNGKNAPAQPFDTNDVFNGGVRDIMAGFSFGFVDNSAGLGNNSKAWYGPPGIPGSSKASKAFDQANYSDPSNNIYYFNAYQWKLYEDSDAYGYPYSDIWQTVQADVGDGYTVEIVIAAD